MPKKLFICGLMAVAMIGMVDHARAQAAPYQDEAVIEAGQTSVNWDVPAATYGPLLSLQAYNLTNGATLAVQHIIPVTSSVSLTNTVETAAAGATLLVYPPGTSYVCTNTTLGTVVTYKPILLTPGDKLRFTTSIAHGSAGYVVIRAGFTGK